MTLHKWNHMIVTWKGLTLRMSSLLFTVQSAINYTNDLSSISCVFICDCMCSFSQIKVAKQAGFYRCSALNRLQSFNLKWRQHIKSTDKTQSLSLSRPLLHIHTHGRESKPNTGREVAQLNRWTTWQWTEKQRSKFTFEIRQNGLTLLGTQQKQHS